MSQAEQAKEKGNLALKNQDYQGAVASYTEAINLDPNQVAYYTNRSLAYISLLQFDNALLDTEIAIKLDPNSARAYQRKGQSLKGLNKLKEAADALKKGLELDPTNQQIMNLYRDCLKSLQPEGGPSDAQKKQAKAIEEIFKGYPIAICKSIPDIAHLAQDKAFCNKLEEIKRDLSKLQHYITDEKIQTFLGTAIQLNQISQMTSQERDALMKKEQEYRLKQEKREEQEREQKRKAEKEKKEMEEKKRKRKN